MMALFNTTSRREQGGLHTRQPICLMVHGAGPGQLPACGLAMARVPIRHTHRCCRAPLLPGSD